MRSSDSGFTEEKINVVFLHGYCEGKWIWQELLSYLPESFQYHAINLPGTGDNIRLPEQVTIEAVATEIWRMLDEKKIRQPVLIGHSLGGYVALAMAEANPDAVKGIALFHSMPFADHEAKKENRNKVISTVRHSGKKSFLDVFAPGLFRDSASETIKIFRDKIEDTPAETIIYYAAAMRDRKDRMKVLADFPNPVLLLGGLYDSIILPETLNEVAAQLEGAEIQFLTDSGHAGMLEEPRKSAEIIENFIKKCFKCT